MEQVTHMNATEITIRAAHADDSRSIARIAGRDSRRVPQGRLLVAVVGADIRAAISLDDGATVADPFHRTAELVEMLRLRSRAVGRRFGAKGDSLSTRGTRPLHRGIHLRARTG